jgi:hypothetical protein
VPWKVLESSGTIPSPGRRNLHITAAVLGIVLPQRISHRVKLTRLAANSLHVLASTATSLKKLKNTMVNSVELIARATRFER